MAPYCLSVVTKVSGGPEIPNYVDKVLFKTYLNQNLHCSCVELKVLACIPSEVRTEGNYASRVCIEFFQINFKFRGFQRFGLC